MFLLSFLIIFIPIKAKFQMNMNNFVIWVQLARIVVVGDRDGLFINVIFIQLLRWVADYQLTGWSQNSNLDQQTDMRRLRKHSEMRPPSDNSLSSVASPHSSRNASPRQSSNAKEPVKQVNKKTVAASNARKAKKQAKQEAKKQAIMKANQILKRMQEQFAEDSATHKHSDDEDSNTCAEIPDYALAQKRTKNNRKSGKVRNKYFDLQIEDLQDNSHKQPEEHIEKELEELERQYQQLAAQKNVKNAAIVESRKEKLYLRVNKIRERMEFKNAHEDNRFKQHLKQRLNDVKDCEEVNLVVEVPKIFRGSMARQADGALFLKNISSQNKKMFSQQQGETNNRSEHSQGHQNKEVIVKTNKRIDGKNYYCEFGKSLKETKTFEYDGQKQLFKKSELDDLEFEKDQHLFKDQQHSNRSRSRSFSRSLQEELADRSRLSRRNSQDKKSQSQGLDSQEKHKNQQMKTSHLEPISSVKQEKQNEESKTNEQASKPTLVKQQQAKLNDPKRFSTSAKNKNNKDEKQRKKKTKTRAKERKYKTTQMTKEEKKSIKALFQEEAQISGDEEAGSNSSPEDDNTSLEDLIDNDSVHYNVQNERLARKKYFDQEHERQLLIMQKIKEKMQCQRKVRCQEDSESRKRRKQRIDAVKSKFQAEDGEASEEFILPSPGLFQKDEQNSSQIEQKKKDASEFQKHLKDLQEQIKNGQKKEKNGSVKDSTKKKIDKSKSRHKMSQWKQIKSIIREGIHEKRGGLANTSKVANGKVGVKRISQGKKKKQLNLE